MRKLLLLLGLIFCAAHAHASCTTPITAGMNNSQVQTAINSCSSGSTATFPAGTYNISSTLTLPCGVSASGPTTDTASYTAWHTLTYHSQTAILSVSGGSVAFFQINSGCTTAMTIQHLQFSGSSALWISTPSSNVTFEYNSVINLPCHQNNGIDSTCYLGNDTAIFINGVSNTLTNFTAVWNQFGDPGSCITPFNVMASLRTSDEQSGGNCAGIITAAFINGLTLQNNSFYHMDEGMHILCNGDQCNAGGSYSPPVPTISNFTLSNNDFQQIHRINGEYQPQGATAWTLQNNSIWNPFTPISASMGFSMACCNGNAPLGLLPGNVLCGGSGEPACTSATPATPNVPIIQNNVMIQNNTPSTDQAGNSYSWAYTIEWWGWGSQVQHNLMQGLSVNGGATWGAGYSPWAFNYNSVCGPNMGSNIVSEGYPNIIAPSQTGNASLSSSCSATTTTTPSISPGSSAQTFPLTVTLTDAGNTGTTPIPQGNVSVWYTTDGSTPSPNSGTSKTCTTVGSTSCTFTIPSIASCGSPCVVKAVGMWGQGANTISYPSGYGFVPSSVMTATYTSGTPPVLTSCSQTNAGPITSLSVGGTVQQVGKCTYASTATTDTCSPGADTNSSSITAWGSSNSLIFTVSGSGFVTAVAPGTANVTASATQTGSSPITCTPYSITVISPPTLSSASMVIQTGGASVQAGSSAQMCVNLGYTSPTENTQVCGSGTDAYNTTVSTYLSSSTANATVGSSTGIVRGVAAGNSTISATAGSFNPNLAITITPAPIEPTFQLNGAVQFGGDVVIQ